MKITGLELFPVSVPLKLMGGGTYGGSYYGGITTLNFIILRLNTDDGISGAGEAGAFGTWGESPKVAITALTELGEAIQGMNPMEPYTIHKKMAGVLKDNRISKAAIDMALHDIRGKALGVPAYTLLGGLCRSKVQIHASLGINEIEIMEREAVGYLETGLRTIKVKAGRDPAKDVQVMQRIRKIVGDNRVLMVDFNQGYESTRTAIDTIRRMEETGPLIVEQPVIGWDIEGLAEVRRSTNSIILADEAVWEPQDCLRVAQHRAADAIHVYLQKPGSIRSAEKCVAIAEAGRMVCALGGMGDLGVATAAELHFCAAMENIRPDVVPCGMPGPIRIVEDIIKVPHTFKDGALDVPTGPGLGVELDEGKLKKFRADL